MAVRKRWKDEQEAFRELERCFRNVQGINRMVGLERTNIDVLDTIGASLCNQLFNFCEALIYLVCAKKATPNGTEPYVTMKDMSKRGHLIDAPINVRLSAEAFCKMKKQFIDGIVTPAMIEDILQLTMQIVPWAAEILRDNSWIEEFTGHLYHICKSWYDELQDNKMMHRLDFLHVGDINEDNLTDEELDALYRIPAGARKRKSMAPLFIYLILKEHTDAEHRFTQKDIMQRLEKDYGITLGRKAIGGQLDTLSDSDVNIQKATPNNGGGYWYEEDIRFER